VIALIDYGAGNLTSVKKALTALDAEFVVPAAPDECLGASGVIVPGVGHFSATRALDAAWCDAIRRTVDAGAPLLGICVGMQWLYEGSEEAPDVPGLGIVDGRCRLLKGDASRRLKVPHVGWNALAMPRESRLLAGIPDGAFVYFTHSYAAPVTGDCVASTRHGEAFAAAVERGRVSGVQFHPEKSGDVGLRVLRNYLDLCRRC
jgi:glutamine amidotransferase